MAILKMKQGEVEVRIKRDSDDTYYDEYVKVEGKEDYYNERLERYIVAEPGTTYYIEVTLKKNFDFGANDHMIEVALFFPGHTGIISSKHFYPPENKIKLIKDRTLKLRHADVRVDGWKVLGATLAFNNIEIDETLSNETDIMGVLPNDLATFKVEFNAWSHRTIKSTSSEYSLARLKWRDDCDKIRLKALKDLGENDQSDARKLWDAKKVDQASFKKHGISSAIGFEGGKMDPFNLPREPTPTKTEWTFLETLGEFEFQCRSAEFLEQVGIVKYPPSLHCYAWEILAKYERQTAFEEMQVLDKKNWHEDQEEKTGMLVPMVCRGQVENQPWEWRNWSKMYAGEKEKAFRSLQKKLKARSRGIIQNQYENMMGEIIALDDEDDKPRSNPRNKDGKDKKRENASSDEEGVKIKREENLRNMADSHDAQKATGAKTIKNEPIDLDDDHDSIIVVSETKNPILPLAPRKEEEGLADEELLRKEEAALKKLEEDIAQEERLLKMKRERDALQERIDAARSKKRVKTG